MNTVFVAWSRLSRRSRDLADLLDAEIVFIPSRAPYLSAFIRTWRHLKEMKPDIAFVQLPQGPLLWEIIRLSKSIGFKVVADVHTGFVYSESLKSAILNRPFNRLLKRVDLVLAHNDPQKLFMVNYLKLDESRIVTVYDPLPRMVSNLVKPFVHGLEPYGFVMLPVSWAGDEPIDFVVEEFLESRASREYKLVVTNDYSRNRKLYSRVLKAVGNKKDGVIFTGYLRREEYYWLIANSRTIIALTNREYTMLSAIWEAVAYSKPFIVSETRTLRTIIGEYPCFFKYRKKDLQNVLDKCIYDPPVNSIEKTIDYLKKLSLTSIEKLEKRLRLSANTLAQSNSN